MRRLILFLLLAAIAAGGYYAYNYWLFPPQPTNYLTLYGNVDVRLVDLGFRVSGRVEEMYFEEGDEVKAGTLMGLLNKEPYFDQLKDAEATVEARKRTLDNSEKLYKRRQELIQDGSVSLEDLQNAESAKTVDEANLDQALASEGVAKSNLSFTELFSPSDGTILTRVREPGTVVKEADPIYTLCLVTPVWVRAYISERNLGIVYPGMSAEVYTDTPGSEVYKGHVGFISPVSEFTPKSVETTDLRTDLVYRLRVIVDNPDRGLRQGMPVTVRLLLPERYEK